MRTLWQDIRYAARTLRKNAGFTLVAVAALALGIGANTAIFSVVNAVLLRPLPFEEPGRIVYLTGRAGADGAPTRVFSYPNFLDVKSQARVFEHAAAYGRAQQFLTEGDEPERVQGAYVSAEMFPLLGVGPALGRAFTADEDQPGAPRVVVLGHGLWERRFGSDPSVVGREVQFASGPATVVGVMPRGFKFPVEERQTEFWMAFARNVPAGQLSNRGAVFLEVVARLAPGVTHEQARAEADVLARRLAEQHPADNTGLGIVVTPLHESLVGETRTALLILLGAVGLVLLIACANVANLLLARAASRQKEIAVRTALGASRLRIVRQLLTESLLLALAGGALGLLLALWGVDLLAAASPADIPRVGEIGLDPWVLLFTLGTSLVTGVVFGLVPAWQASKAEVHDALKEGGRGSTEGGRGRVRAVLVVSEVALSLVLLVGAGLLLRSFAQLLDVSPGFESRNLLAADVAFGTTYKEDAQRVAFVREALARASAAPGVRAVGAVDPLPLGGNFTAYSFEVEGRTPARPGEEPDAQHRVVTPDYFRAMAIPVRRGRVFAERDDARAPFVVVVNETFVRRYFGGEEPLGRRLRFDTGGGATDNPLVEIVGVVGDVRHAGLEAPPDPEMYVPFAQSPRARMSFVARTEADPLAAAPALRAALRQLDARQPVYNVRPMEQLLSQSVARRRFNLALLALFASVALALAAVGIYGVMAYTVEQRRHEIGIRLALGAQARDVFRLVVGQGMGLALAGIGLGLVAALAATRLMSSLLYGVSAADPLTYAGIALLLAGVAFAACYLPARRASRVDPMDALRQE
jgi:putative ABC transport system permease protein